MYIYIALFLSCCSRASPVYFQSQPILSAPFHKAPLMRCCDRQKKPESREISKTHEIHEMWNTNTPCL